MRVSLAPPRLIPHGQVSEAVALLKPGGAEVILGGHVAEDGLSESILPSATTLFGPRGACLASPQGPLLVCDTGHHRLLVWKQRPAGDNTPADFLIGHADFTREGRNSKLPVGATTLNVPTGIAASNDVLAVADAWNHRVLIWHGLPTRSQQPPDVVLGQADFLGGLANRGKDAPAADTLNWCYGVTLMGERLIVCDTGNRRLLVWNQMPQRSGQAADMVLGQADFTTRNDSAGGVDDRGMRWPHASAPLPAGGLAVADAGRNRIMLWDAFPAQNGAPCDRVLGQADFAGQDANRAGYLPTADCLNMPYGIAAMERGLLVADTANSRLLGWEPSAAAATALAGQYGFSDKGDNRWRAAVRDSVCWPYGVSLCGDTAVIADSGNNRVLLWALAA